MGRKCKLTPEQKAQRDFVISRGVASQTAYHWFRGDRPMPSYGKAILELGKELEERNHEIARLKEIIIGLLG